MTKDNLNSARQIDALTSAAEFLMCAVRAIAMGGEFSAPGVADPVMWARQKIIEAEVVGIGNTQLT